MLRWLTKRKEARSASVDVHPACQEHINRWRQSGQPHLLKQAIEAGLKDGLVVDNESSTILHLAAINGFLNSLVFLYASGFKDVYANSAGALAVHLAAGNGHKDCVHYLLKNMASGLNAEDGKGYTPLMLAAQAGHVDVLEMLLQRGADAANIYNTDGLLALHLCRKPRELRCLLGATRLTVDTPDRHGRTTLMHATADGNRAMILDVLQLRADVRLCDKLGRNALHHAAIRRMTELVPLLIKAGCPTADVDERGFTPVEHSLLLHDVDTAYAFYCAGAILSKRQLLLLGILLRESSLLRALIDEGSKASGVLRELLREPEDRLSRLTITPGVVPFKSLDEAAFRQEMSALADPITRPEGSEASDTLVDVFSRFLRHSTGRAVVGEGKKASSVETHMPSRHSESALARAGHEVTMKSGGCIACQAVLHGPADEGITGCSDAGRRTSLERMLPFYLQGLAAGSQGCKPGRRTVNLGNGGHAHDLHGGGRPARLLARNVSLLTRSCLGDGPQSTSSGAGVADVLASSFWGTGRTAPSAAALRRGSLYVRRSKTLNDVSFDVVRSTRRDVGSGSWNDGMSGIIAAPRSSGNRARDEPSSGRLPAVQMDLASHGMLEFEEMMARRVALFARSASRGARPT